MAEGRVPSAPEYRLESVRVAGRLVKWPRDPQHGESKRAFRWV